MTESGKEYTRRKAPNLGVIGIGLAAFVWVLDSFVDVFFFNQGDFVQQVITPEPYEIYVRAVLSSILVLFGFLAQRTVTRHKRTEEELREHRENLEELVAERTTNLERAIKEMDREITERKRAEEALEKSELWMRNIFNSLEEAVFVVTPDRILKNMNLAAEKMFGYTKDEVDDLSTEVVHVDHEHYLEFGRRINEAFGKGESASFEFVLKRKNGEVFPTEHTVSLLKSDAGEPLGIVSVVRDITERKRAEDELLRANEGLREAYETLEQSQEQLIHSEKLAALGRLTAGVSHEILNPLNIITMSIHLMLGDSETPSEVTQQLQVLKEQAFRINKITQNLLYFARQMGPERRSIDFNETAERTLSLIEHDLKLESIAMEVNLADELPPVYADRNQLQQVILNLMGNARDAMPEGGRLTLDTEMVQAGGQKFVELRVEDTGPGIDPEHLDKLFDPFFTTKAEGEGMGLGLSICQGIVEAHGGEIRAENVPGGGAVFVVKLGVDVVDDAAGKVLVVDDEPFHCEMLRRFFMERGYNVVEAHDGDKALELYRRERPGLVLLDVRMPGKGGLETLRELKALDPEAKVIMLSAVPERELAGQARAEGALEYIAKPVNLSYLETAFVAMMGRPSGGD